MSISQEISNEVLNEIELSKVIAFANDKLLLESVKKYLLAVAYKHGVIKKGIEHKGNVNFALNLAWGACQGGGVPRSDEELGQALRALTYAVQLVESGFNEIAEMTKVEEGTEEKFNKAE